MTSMARIGALVLLLCALVLAQSTSAQSPSADDNDDDLRSLNTLEMKVLRAAVLVRRACH